MSLKRIIQKTLAILIILMMTLADFSTIGINLITYASNVSEINNKNVGFEVYFADENKSIEKTATIDSNDLKIAIELSVKNDGYLSNGKITLDNNANVKFKGEITNRVINKIEDKTIYLNQINEGDNIRFEVGIEFAGLEEMSGDYLSKTSNIRLTGIYLNSKNIENNTKIDIEGNTELKINWKSPSKAQAKLNAELLTNFTYKDDQSSKRIVQFLISSKITDNSYPVKNTDIELVLSNLVENVTVHKRTTSATNGDRDFTYNYNDNKLEINIQNGKDNKISWIRDSEDAFVVTMEYPEEYAQELSITEPLNRVKLTSKITMYDEKILTQEAEILVNEQKEGIASGKQIETEHNIGKGKLYTGEERLYNTKSVLYVDYAKAINNITIEESKPVFTIGNEEKESKIEYLQTSIDKDKFIEIFGEEGTINIKDQAENDIATITKNTETDEEGKIVIKYAPGVTELKITTSNPQKEGIIHIAHEKKILKTNLSRNDINKLTSIKDSSRITFKIANYELPITQNSIAQVMLDETESKASLTIEPTALSTEQESQELRFKVILKTNDENKDLYKNPVIKLKLPKQINRIKATGQLLYGNGLEIKDFKIQEENGQEVIYIKLLGEQTSYEGQAVEGATLLIKATVGLDRLATNSLEEVVLKFSNENATTYTNNGEEKAQINIISKSKMILTNNIREYNITTVGNEGSKTVDLANNVEEKNTTISAQVINNEEADISDIAILGKIANISGKIERTSQVKTNVESNIYYTTIENPTIDINDTKNKWTTQNLKNAKYYLVKINNVKNSEKVNITYNVAIRKNLGYNLETETSYTVYYTNSLTGKNKEEKSTNLMLTTGKIAEINLSLTETVGGETLKDGDEVKAGEVISYTARISNTGKEKAEDVELIATIPDNTTLIEINPDYTKQEYNEDEEENELQESEIKPNEYFISKQGKEVKKQNITIEAGKTINYTITLRVNSDLAEATTGEMKLVVKHKGQEVKTETISNKFSKSSLVATLMPLERTGNDEIKSGEGYIYKLNIYNPTDVEQKEVKVTINKNDIVKIEAIDYLSGTQYEQVDNKNLTFKINSIAPKDTAYIEIDTVIGKADNSNSTADMSIIVKDSTGTTYRSNKLSEKVKGPKIEAVLTATTKQKNGYVKPGDEIKYTIKLKNNGTEDIDNLVIKDRFSDYLKLEKVTLEGKETEYTRETEFGKVMDYDAIVINMALKAGKIATIEITGKVNENISTTETLKIINKALVYSDSVILAETDESTYFIQPITGLNEALDDEYDTDSMEKYIIAGTVWFDEDENGLRDIEEDKLEGIRVYAISVTTNEVVKETMTDSEGNYTLTDLPKGKYIVAFEYSTEIFIVTMYKAEGVSQDKNSDAIKEIRNINGETKTVAATDSLLVNTNLNNIDLGLTEAKVFDLKIEKVISKMIVTNSEGTKTYDFKDTNLAKVEISAKNLKDSSVVVEYKIKVTNNGDVPGYAKSIVDYIPSSLTFNSSLNSDWYQQDGNIYTTSLSDTIIEPGETKEVKLTLTKKMTESNTGLTNNKAEIAETYNSLGLQNVSETQAEPNGEFAKETLGSADMIVGVKTGKAVSYVALTIMILVIICGVAYLVNKIILVRRIRL